MWIRACCPITRRRADAKAFNDLVRVNKWVNDTIKPMTDLD